MAFGTGVVVAAAVAGFASTPHCAAMCGPLALAACSGRAQAVRYGAGRFLSYAALGAIAGSATGRLTQFLRGEHVQQAIALVLAAGLAAAAVRVLRVQAPAAPLVPLRRGRLAVPPMVVGLATGLLPCGALASGLLLAAGAASAWGGALAMTVFAACSAPGLIAVAASGNRIGAFLARALPPSRRRLAAVALLLVAAWTASRPWVMPERRCHCAHPQSTAAFVAPTQAAHPKRNSCIFTEHLRATGPGPRLPVLS